MGMKSLEDCRHVFGIRVQMNELRGNFKKNYKDRELGKEGSSALAATGKLKQTPMY